MKSTTFSLRRKILLINLQRKVDINSNCIHNAARMLDNIIPPVIKNINIVLVSDRKMKLFNKKFLKKTYSTDVLAFNLGSTLEIIISVETAKKQAKQVQHTIENEILYLIIHGILHISGYDDDNTSNYDKMKARQDEIFSKILKNVSAKRKE